MSDTKLTFGKYRGRKLNRVPTEYLQWCIDDCMSLGEWLRAEIEKELALRSGMEIDEEQKIDESLTGQAKELAEKVNLIYRQLAMQYHPDRGGSNTAMKAINEFHIQVQNLLKRELLDE